MAKTIAAYGGGFKPPTAGHFEVVKSALEQFPEIDEFTIYVGGGERDGITQAEAVLIWEIYQSYLPMKVKIEPSKAPIGDIIRLGKNNPQDTVYFVIGAREKNQGDLKDIESRTKGVEEKYPNMKIKVISTAGGGMSGTNARKAAKVSPEEFYKYLPSELTDEEKEEVYNIVKPMVNEASIPSASEIKSKFKDLIAKVKQQGGDAKKALIMLVKAAKGDINLTNDDKVFIKLQLKDALKAVLGTAIFALPAGSLVLILLKAIKLHGLVVPTAFLNERLEPYKFKTLFVENENNTTRYTFTTNQGTEYLVDLVNYPKTEVMVEYGAIKDGKKSWINPTNDGEPLKIISTVTEIIKEYYVSNPNLEVVKWEAAKGKNNAKADSQRDKLNIKFFQREVPGIKVVYEGQETRIILPKLNENLSLEEIILEVVPKDILDSFDIQDTLVQDVWDGEKLKPEIREKLLKIAQDFFDSLDLPEGVKLKDIKLTGSLANYNWSKFSDVDLHLVLDYADVDDDEEFVRNYFMAKKGIWNDAHDITIYDFPVEVYVENEGESHTASGLYSVLNDEWIVIPKKQEVMIDKDDITTKAEGYMSQLETIQKLYNDGKYKEVIDKVDKIKERLRDMRSAGLEKGGEYSVENLAFKVLRRSDFIGQLNDLKSKSYDTMMTLKEKVSLNENATYSKDIDIIEKCAALTNHMREKGYKIDPLPSIEFVNGDTENARDFFGKTAYYDPNEQKIVLYTEGRHPKDIVRSFAHEMIHHVQNLEDRLGNITTTDTTEDSNLEDIEKEAYLNGNISFRNWTDSLQEKKNKDPFGLNQYARELAQGLEEELDEGRKKKKDPKKGTGKKPEGSGRRLYTDEDPKDTVGVSFRTKEDIVDTLNKKSFKAKSHARQSQVINLIHQRVRAAYGRAKDPETKARLKRGLDYIEKRKEASKKKTQRLKAQKENVAPNHDGKAAPFGSGYEELNEGRYDAFVNKLSRIVFEMFKDIHDRGDKKGEFEFRVDHPDDEHDIPSEDFYFDLAGTVEITDDEYTVDGGANAGFDKDGNEITPLLSVKFKIPKNPDWQKVSFDIKDVVRHELEHLTQDGENVKGGTDSDDPKLVRPSKQMDDDQMIRDLIDLDLLPKADYFRLPKEIDAMLQGLYFKAKKSRTPFKDVINTYLDTQPINDEERENILKIWRNRAKALSLPLFEELEEMEYEIYSDMDGVITDFDASFMKASDGIRPSEYERNMGKDKFWELIDGKGVGFWVGMPWMSDGKQYWDYIKQYNPILLSSPSRSNTSRLGKRLWVRNNLPGTKLILAQAKDKQNYARKNRILIDDRPSNIEEWRSQGGIGILHTSASNTIRQLKELGL